MCTFVVLQLQKQDVAEDNAQYSILPINSVGPNNSVGGNSLRNF